MAGSQGFWSVFNLQQGSLCVPPLPTFSGTSGRPHSPSSNNGRDSARDWVVPDNHIALDVLRTGVANGVQRKTKRNKARTNWGTRFVEENKAVGLLLLPPTIIYLPRIV